MIANLIFGIAAGALAPRAEPHVMRALEGGILHTPLTPMELRMLSFALCLVAAAILGAVFDDDGAVPLAVGAVAGVFAPRILAHVRRRRYPDYDDGLNED